MFRDTKAFGGFSVDDIEAARRFYGDTLGLRTSLTGGMLVLHLAGERDVLVYPKQGHQPATFTILNFPVEDIDAAVAELGRRGVAFERYEDFGADAQGIVRGAGEEGMPAGIAWFRDPAGNVLAVLQER